MVVVWGYLGWDGGEGRGCCEEGGGVVYEGRKWDTHEEVFLSAMVTDRSEYIR